MDRHHLAQLFEEMGTFLDLLGENPFKVRAHQNAARIIETFDGDLEKAIADKSIGEVKGIGPATVEKLEEFLKTGKIAEHEKLQKKIDPGLLELIKIPGLGPKRVRAIHDQLK